MIKTIVKFTIFSAVMLVSSFIMFIQALDNYIAESWLSAAVQTVVCIFDLVIATVDVRIACKKAKELDEARERQDNE